MKLNIAIDYKRTEEQIKATGNAELTMDYIAHVVRATHPDGIEGQLKRIWGRLQRKLDEAIESKNYVIDIENAELDLLTSSFEKAKYPSDLTKFFVILEDILVGLSKEEKKEDKK